MLFETTIPVRPHLKKYLFTRFKAGDKAILIDKSFLMGKLIIKAFSEQNNKPKRIDKITDSIRIIFDHERDLTLSDGNVYDFNQLIEDYYRRELGIFVGVHFIFGSYPERKQAIYLFNDLFGITEDEVGIDCLIKHLQRNPEDTKLFENQYR